MSKLITVKSPFPLSEINSLWEWANEFPSANFDDYGPKDKNAFYTHMLTKLTQARSWIVLRGDNIPSGFIAYVPITARMGMFQGICFPKKHLFHEEKIDAVSQVLTELFGRGVEKVIAQFFADNNKIEKFLTELGAEQEGFFYHHTIRDGRSLSMKQFAIFKENFKCPLE